eukprot:gene3189-5505_t
MTEVDVKNLRKTDLKRELQTRGIFSKSHKKTELLRLLIEELEKEGLEIKKQNVEEKTKKKEFQDFQSSKDLNCLQFVKRKTVFFNTSQTVCLEISADEKHLIESSKKKKTFTTLSSIKDIVFEQENLMKLVLNTETCEFHCSNNFAVSQWKVAMRYFVLEKRGANLDKSNILDIPTKIKVGVPQFFTIESFDLFGRKINVGNDNWKVCLISENGDVYNADVVDFEDGTYKIGFVLFKTGIFKLTIAIRNEMTTTSLIVFPDEIDLKKTLIEAPRTQTAGEMFEILILMRDQFNNIVETSSDRFSFNISHSLLTLTNSTSKLHENKFTIIIHQADMFDLQITFDDQNIYDEKLEVIPSSYDHFKIQQFEGISTSLVENSFDIMLFDKYNNLLHTNHKIHVDIKNEEFESDPGVFSEIHFQRGTYKVKFTPKWKGEHSIVINLNNEALNEIPIIFNNSANFNEPQRKEEFQQRKLKKIEEETERIELEKRYKLKEEIEYKINQKYPDWISFRNLLNRLIRNKGRYDENLQKIIVSNTPRSIAKSFFRAKIGKRNFVQQITKFC